MRNLEFNVNNKTYLKMIQIDYLNEKYQMASTIDIYDFEPKFFKIIDTKDSIQYLEVDSDTLKELKAIYWQKSNEIIY